MKKAFRYRAALICAAGLAILVAAGLSSRPSIANNGRLWTGPLSGQQFGQDQPGGVKGLIRIFVHNESLYPELIRVRPGLIRLRAENETLSDVSLVVEKVDAGPVQRVVNVRTLRHGKRAEQEIGLGVGEYVYYDEARPEIRGRIIVEP